MGRRDGWEVRVVVCCCVFCGCATRGFSGLMGSDLECGHMVWYARSHDGAICMGNVENKGDMGRQQVRTRLGARFIRDRPGTYVTTVGAVVVRMVALVERVRPDDDGASLRLAPLRARQPGRGGMGDRAVLGHRAWAVRLGCRPRLA